MFRPHSSTLKPTLTPANMLARAMFALHAIDPSTLEFKAMDCVVHLDEKWFYLTKEKCCYYLVDG